MVHIIHCIDLNCFQQLPCVRYFTVCLEGCWRSLLSRVAVILYGWYNTGWQVVLIFSSCFLLQGELKKFFFKDIYINNYNNYNCNKQKPQTINVSSQCGMNKPASGKKISIQNTTLATYTWLWSRDCLVQAVWICWNLKKRSKYISLVFLFLPIN